MGTEAGQINQGTGKAKKSRWAGLAFGRESNGSESGAEGRQVIRGKESESVVQEEAGSDMGIVA